jgi:hypothetical protein
MRYNAEVLTAKGYTLGGTAFSGIGGLPFSI